MQIRGVALSLLLSILIVGDCAHSWTQYAGARLDGDMAGGIVPAEDVQVLFTDPFGMDLLTGADEHPNPNRYFAHLFFKEYFQRVPLLLQAYFNPIESVYLACTLLKIFAHVGLLLVLGALMRVWGAFTRQEILLGMLLMTVMFQYGGYGHYMRIIDVSVTYTSFYALPLLVLLLFTLFFFKIRSSNSSSWWWQYFGIPVAFVLAVVLPFSGPLIPALMLVAGVLLGVRMLTGKPLLIGRTVISLILITMLLSTYSLYLGTYNSATVGESISLLERYSRLPNGVYLQFTQKLGFPILMVAIFLNKYLLRKKPDGEKFRKAFAWFGIFALAYIFLLPLGGYRPYRPNILRYDTIMPITIGLLFAYAYSSVLILKLMKKGKLPYVAWLLSVSLIFAFVDCDTMNENDCEIAALEELATSSEPHVELDEPCKVMSWQVVTDPVLAELNAKLLYMWGITDEVRTYSYSGEIEGD